MRTSLQRLLFTAGLAVSVLAAACPVCGTARNEEVNATYVAMTMFMSLTPLALIFGLAAFVVIKIRRAEAAEQQTAPEPPAPSESAQ